MKIIEVDEGLGRALLSLGRKGINAYRNIGTDSRPVARLYTNPANLGADVNSKLIANLPINRVNINSLELWEPASKMKSLSSTANVQSLITAIRQGQTLPPITVVAQGGKYRIVDGHHRYAAYRQAGVTDVPVQILSKNQVNYSDELIKAQSKS